MKVHANSALPAFNPKGWTPLKSALQAFGGIVVGDIWRNLDDDDLRLARTMGYPKPRPITAGQPIEMSQVEWANFYLVVLCNAFSAGCRNEHLRTAFREIGGGTLTAMPPDWWQTDDPLLRFVDYGIDPTQPFSQSAPSTNRIFVNVEDMVKAAERVEVWREQHSDGCRVADLKMLPPEGRNFIGHVLVRIYPSTKANTVIAGPPLLDIFEERFATVIPREPDPIIKDASAKRTQGRPTKKFATLRIFISRLKDRRARQGRMDEAREIIKCWAAESPPRDATVSGYLSEFYDLSVWDNGTLTNESAVMEAVNVALERER